MIVAPTECYVKTMNCIICGSLYVPETERVRFSQAIDCPKCGPFRLSEITHALIDRRLNSPEARLIVSKAVAKLDRHGNPYPLIDADFVDAVLQRHGLLIPTEHAGIA